MEPFEWDPSKEEANIHKHGVDFTRFSRFGTGMYWRELTTGVIMENPDS